jgi:pilus assembly protein CpaC
VACALPALAQTPPRPAAMAAGHAGMAAMRTAPAPELAPNLQPCTQVSIEPPTQVTLGKSSVLKLSAPIVRLVVGGAPAGRTSAPGGVALIDEAAGARAPSSAPASDGVAQVDIVLLGPTELFFLGRRPGAMNLVLQAADGRCFVRDVMVTVDPDSLQTKLTELLPAEKQIRVRALEGSLVLTGQVSDALKADEVMSLALSLGEGRRVINLLRVSAPQQVMLEVKIAEVSKGVLDRLGIDLTRVVRTGDGGRIITGLFGGSPLLLGKTATTNIGLSGRADVGRGLGLDIGAGKDTLAASSGQQGASGTLIGIDAQTQDALVRVLAEPNIMAVSGQSASFLSGGKIYIPVRQGNGAVSLEERQYGVGLKFHPTVLDGGRVNLKLTTEASELSQTGAMLSASDGTSTIMPVVSTRQIDTTVQLGDGQSFAVAGLIRNNLTQSVSRFPGLGDLPILGALFRSTAFQKDQTELVFVVTPRLVQPIAQALLPTDVHREPSRQDAILDGRAERGPRSPAPPTAQPTAQPTAPPALPTDTRSQP